MSLLYLNLIIKYLVFYFILIDGLGNALWDIDSTKTSFLMIGAYLIWSFFLARLYSAKKPDQAALGKFDETTSFVSNALITLGLIGTVIGFAIMLAGLTKVDFTSSFEKSAVINMMGSLISGMGTALYTTIIGMGASFIMNIELFINKRILQNKEGPRDVPNENKAHGRMNYDNEPQPPLVRTAFSQHPFIRTPRSRISKSGPCGPACKCEPAKNIDEDMNVFRNERDISKKPIWLRKFFRGRKNVLFYRDQLRKGPGKHQETLGDQEYYGSE